MASDPSDAMLDFHIAGFRCTFFNDPEKSVEINSGKLLVPCTTDANITIDR